MKKILIVDDSADIVERFSAVLDKAGFDVAVARDGDEALAKLSMDPHKPDLILLDIRMPKKNGWQVLSEVRSHASFDSIKIVFCSSERPPVSSSNPAEKGYSAFLQKPVEDKILLGTIQRVLGKN